VPLYGARSVRLAAHRATPRCRAQRSVPGSALCRHPVRWRGCRNAQRWGGIVDTTPACLAVGGSVRAGWPGAARLFALSGGRMAAAVQVGAGEPPAFQGEADDPGGAGERYGVIDSTPGVRVVQVGAGLLDLLSRGVTAGQAAEPSRGVLGWGCCQRSVPSGQACSGHANLNGERHCGPLHGFPTRPQFQLQHRPCAPLIPQRSPALPGAGSLACRPPCSPPGAGAASQGRRAPRQGSA